VSITELTSIGFEGVNRDVVCETKLSVCKCEEEIDCFGENVESLKEDWVALSVIMIVGFTEELSEDKRGSSMTAVGSNLDDACSVGEARKEATPSVGSWEELAAGI
jgi:hypothetical protein